MTRDEAVATAQREANEVKRPIDVWVHVGGTGVMGRGSYLTRDPSLFASPRWNRWELIETAQPA